MIFQVPDHCKEYRRCKTVDLFASLPHWENIDAWKRFAAKIRKEMGTKGITISIVDRLRTVVKAEIGFDVTRIPKIASIDAHAILSRDYLFIPNAASDWRTSQNPLVVGSPNIRFYLGVPLMAPNGLPIGVIEIFDSFVSKNMGPSSAIVLQRYACQIMNALQESPAALEANLGIQKKKNVNSNTQYQADELKHLKKEFGRATSRGNTTIFEKDGSGGPYTQNHNLRFSRYYNKLAVAASEESISPPNLRNNSSAGNMLSPNTLEKNLDQMLYQRLLNSASFKASAAILSKTIATSLNFEMVYFMEIRIAETFQIKNEYFPGTEKKITVDNFEHSQMLIHKKGDKKTIMKRVIEGYGGSKFGKLRYEDSIHKEAFLSDFGVKYRAKKQTALFNEGVLLTFHKSENSLARRGRGSKTKSDMVDVYLKGTGYIVACFNETSKEDINDKTTVQILNYCQMLKSIYLSE